MRSERKHGPDLVRLGKNFSFYFKQGAKPLTIFGRGVILSDFVVMRLLFECYLNIIQHTPKRRMVAGRPVRMVAWTSVSEGRCGK